MPSGELDAVVAALMGGLPVVVPTDTLYGLAVSPLHASTPHILYDIKGRPSDKPVAWLVAHMDDLGRFGVGVPAYARRLVAAFWPGALTVIVRASDAVPPAYRSQAGTIGLRMPDDALVRAIADEVGCPLAVTSANLSGQRDPKRFDDLDPAVLSRVAAAIDDQRRKSGIGSTVVDCTGDSPRILREGGITRADIDGVLAG